MALGVGEGPGYERVGNGPGYEGVGEGSGAAGAGAAGVGGSGICFACRVSILSFISFMFIGSSFFISGMSISSLISSTSFITILDMILGSLNRLVDEDGESGNEIGLLGACRLDLTGNWVCSIALATTTKVARNDI